jgi:nucleoside-diphosphate-sugar epimerase
MSTVLVTGGSGFIAGHTILQLLAAGHEVRTTVRSLKRTMDVRAKLNRSRASSLERLSFAIADLDRDGGWEDAVADCEYVLHVASPLPLAAPKHEDEIIVPARAGTLRVLRAARTVGVRRVVLTSSFAAIGYGHAPQTAPFEETTWTNLNVPGLSAYVKSKTLAERAAWDFFAAAEGKLELAVVNPVAIFGPVLDDDLAASTTLVQRMLDGSLPGHPRLWFGVVDVRDVADLHLRAMTDPAANGQRFLATAGDCVSMLEIARMLKQGLGESARKVPLRQIPDWLMRVAAIFNSTAKQGVSELGKVKNASSAKARNVLGWSARSREEAIVATAESLLKVGAVKL